MTHRTHLMFAACGAALALTACTTSSAGTPTSEPGRPSSSSTGSAPSSDSDTYGAPRVENPLDATRFLNDPCSVLTPAQLTTFGVSRPGTGDTESPIAKAAGPICNWHADPGVDSTIGVTWQRGNKNGLADLYRMRDEVTEYFIETTVSGYPAVFNSPVDSRNDGHCGIAVGVSDTLTFTASESGTLDAEGACARAKQVAAAVIVTMKENQ